MYPNKKDFFKFAKLGNVVPVFCEIHADLETPVSAYQKLGGKYSFLLESVEGGDKIARFSFIGKDPRLIFRSYKNQIEIIQDGNVEKLKGDPFVYLKQLLKKYRAVKLPGLPPFHGGMVGYIGYDNVRFIEEIPDRLPDDQNVFDIQLQMVDTLLAFDRVKQKIIIIANAFVANNPEKAYLAACQKIKDLEALLLKPSRQKTQKNKSRPRLSLTSNFTKKGFMAAIRKAQKYIHAGDIIQIVLSQRFKSKISGDPFAVYRSLRSINPSPYMFYLSFGETKIIGASPEVMVRLEENLATVRPIAGTRPRGKNTAEDQRLSRELLNDTKERAEHVMLVDLARNDLGRVCKYKSVVVTDLMLVEKYSHVMHIVSNVVGHLKKGQDAVDLLRACFPAGTVSGAPKVRAMQIIEEIEKNRRGPYAGCVCYFDFSGGLDSCITIRTIVINGATAYIQAGAGIVADSDPAKELVETQNKAKAALRALEG